MFLSGGRRVARVRASASLWVKFGCGVATRNFPVTIGHRARRLSLAIRRNATKISSYCVVIKSGTSVRVSLFINVPTRITKEWWERRFQLRNGIGISNVLFCLLGSAFRYYVVTMDDPIREEVAASHPRARPRNQVNIKVRVAINVRATRNVVRWTLSLFSLLKDFKGALIRLVVFRGRIGARECNEIFGRVVHHVPFRRTFRAFEQNCVKYYVRKICVNLSVPIVRHISLVMRDKGVLLIRFHLVLFRRNNGSFLIGNDVRIIVLFRRLLRATCRLLFFHLGIRIRGFGHGLGRFEAVSGYFARVDRNAICLAAVTVVRLRKERWASGFLPFFKVHLGPFTRYDLDDAFLFRRFRILSHFVNSSAVLPMVETFVML